MLAQSGSQDWTPRRTWLATARTRVSGTTGSPAMINWCNGGMIHCEAPGSRVLFTEAQIQAAESALETAGPSGMSRIAWAARV